MSLSVEIKGKVTNVTNEEIINNDFKKRGIVLEVQETVGDKEYSNPYFIEFYNDKMSQLDNTTVGEEKTVSANIRCRESEDPNNPGSKRYFTTLVGWRVQ